MQAKPIIVRNPLTIRGASKLAGCAYTTITNAIECGDLNAVESWCGNATLIPLAEVTRWMKNRRKPGPQSK